MKASELTDKALVTAMQQYADQLADLPNGPHRKSAASPIHAKGRPVLAELGRRLGEGTFSLCGRVEHLIDQVHRLQ